MGIKSEEKSEERMLSSHSLHILQEQVCRASPSVVTTVLIGGVIKEAKAEVANSLLTI